MTDVTPAPGREQREAAVTGAAGTSLIPQTIEEMAADADHAEHVARVAALGQAALTREERRRRQRALTSVDAPSFQATLAVRAMYSRPANRSLAQSKASLFQINGAFWLVPGKQTYTASQDAAWRVWSVHARWQWQHQEQR